ncbi:MAG: hypothetical protein ABSF50_10630 [Burkholderiaceae bacterium]|jgi:hypothetical protein
MDALEIVVPDALIPAEIAPALVAGLNLPALRLVAMRGSAKSIVPLEGQAPLTAAQQWILGDSNANLALAWANALDAAPPLPNASLWMLEPAHFTVGQNQLVLGNPAELALDDAESQALAAMARPILADHGFDLEVASRERWLLRSHRALRLRGASIECAIGRSLLDWLPEGDEEAARAWRNAQNEIQMTWFTHGVNTAREAEGQPVVNTLWLSGNGSTDMPRLRYSDVRQSAMPWSALGTSEKPRLALETFQGLSDPARREDWIAWQEALQELDIRIGQRIAEVRSGMLKELILVLCDTATLRTVRLKRRDFWKVWQRGTPHELLAAPEAALS